MYHIPEYFINPRSLNYRSEIDYINFMKKK